MIKLKLNGKVKLNFFQTIERLVRIGLQLRTSDWRVTERRECGAAGRGLPDTQLAAVSFRRVEAPAGILDVGAGIFEICKQNCGLTETRGEPKTPLDSSSSTGLFIEKIVRYRGGKWRDVYATPLGGRTGVPGFAGMADNR